MNFARLFEDCVDRHAESVALIGESQTRTYAELSASASRCAHALGELGAKSQDRVAILSRNTVSCVEVLLGCFKANVVACPLNARLSAFEMAAALSGDEVSVVLFDRGSLDQARYLRSRLSFAKFVGLDEVSAREDGVLLLEGLAACAPSTFDIVDAESEDIALELFTSGTTGLPKAVLHAHSSLCVFMAMFGFAARHELVQRDIPTRDVILGLLSLHHVSGLSTLYGLVSGATVVLQESFDMEAFLDAVQTYRVTRTTVPVPVIEWMLARDDLAKWDLSSLVEISYGGSPIARRTVEEAAHVLNCTLTQAYGSTEALIVTVLTGDDHAKDANQGDQRAFSVGKPLIGVEVAVVDEKGGRCATNEEGEIVVRGPSTMRRYRNAMSDGGGFDDEGWLHMGDLGHLDENGFLYVTGRKRDLIISGGENVYPKEVENCIEQLRNDVESACVIGAPHPKWGETPIAFVVRKAGSSIDEDAVIRHCESHIAHYKRPSSVVFLEALPRDGLGKVARNELSRRYCDAMKTR